MKKVIKKIIPDDLCSDIIKHIEGNNAPVLLSEILLELALKREIYLTEPRQKRALVSQITGSRAIITYDKDRESFSLRDRRDQEMFGTPGPHEDRYNEAQNQNQSRNLEDEEEDWSSED